MCVCVGRWRGWGEGGGEGEAAKGGRVVVVYYRRSEMIADLQGR